MPPTTSTTVPPTTSTTLPPLLDPSSVLVEVLNGSGGPGLASAAALALHRAGFLVNGTGNAASFQHVESVAEYSPGSELAAATVAAYLTGGTQLLPVAGLAPDEVDLVLGSQYHGLSG